MTNNFRLKAISVALLSIGAIAQNVSPPQPTSPEAQVRLGNDYLAQKDYSSAMVWFGKAEYRRAVVAYRFTCGMLCGNGNTLILKKVGHDWKVAKRCGGWVS